MSMPAGSPERQPLTVNIFSVVNHPDGTRSVVTETTPDLFIAFIISDDPTDPQLGMPGTIYPEQYYTIIGTETAWTTKMVEKGLMRYISPESAQEHVSRVAMQGSIKLVIPE